MLMRDVQTLELRDAVLSVQTTLGFADLRPLIVYSQQR